ncbi:rifin PIR protein, putative [Plasmodium reichenowi]|uniref:Rifin PIR protein, putative n=1 Tax=Plasmodium reichenowi TaxID=5854 RepID=A0A2P9DTW6_PLARE|nr:rifin PIR protein, putative [Plasmodium reichenowi]
MKVHYINILLFALPLNILLLSSQENIQSNHKSITPHHTSKIPTTRSLCECELYAPANYDNDPQMKEVRENFNKQTEQRLREYDQHMQEKRMQCKERCDKEIQKIILKDKMEKELMDKFATLQTDIQSDAIPTCVCEKSIADKVEKGCFRCAGVLGGGVMPGFGTIGGSLLGVLSAWKPLALKAAIAAAKKAGAAEGAIAGKAAGMDVVIYGLETLGIKQYCPEIYQSMIKIESFADLKTFSSAIVTKHGGFCSASSTTANPMCENFGLKIGTHSAKGGIPDPASYIVPKKINGLVYKAEQAATAEAAEVSSKTTAALKSQKTGEIAATYMGNQTIIISSIVTIVVIVLIMVIIYLILRYRRKKKMKKKLQYIKLLEE